MVYMSDCPYRKNELYHHGIKGMRWGIRRFQNEDGTLTEEGKRRYGTVENFEASRRKKAESSFLYKHGKKVHDKKGRSNKSAVGIMGKTAVAAGAMAVGMYAASKLSVINLNEAINSDVSRMGNAIVAGMIGTSLGAMGIGKVLKGSVDAASVSYYNRNKKK